MSSNIEGVDATTPFAEGSTVAHLILSAEMLGFAIMSALICTPFLEIALLLVWFGAMLSQSRLRRRMTTHRRLSMAQFCAALCVFGLLVVQSLLLVGWVQVRLRANTVHPFVCVRVY